MFLKGVNLAENCDFWSKTVVFVVSDFCSSKFLAKTTVFADFWLKTRKTRGF